MAKTLIGIIPKYKGEFTAESYKSVTFQRMNYAKIGEDYYQSLADDNLGVELTDTNKWMKLTYKEENDKNISEAVKRTNDAVDAFNKTLLEHAAITISINHTDDRASLNGKNIYIKKVSDDSILTTIPIKEGTDSYSYDLQPDTSYYVTTDELEGYSVPNSGKLAALSNNTREIVLKFESEWFYPTLQIEDGTDCDGTNVVMLYGLSKERVATVYKKGMRIKVPMGTRYQMVPVTKSGYYSGMFVSRIAKELEYHATAVYKASMTDIGIQMTDGAVVHADDLDDIKYSKENVNGILVCTTGVQCVIYPAKMVRLSFGGAESTPEGVDLQSAFENITGQLGEKNTENLVKAYGTGSDYAAGYCYNTTMKSGKRCYLPAEDELAQIYSNRAAINACSQKILGIDIVTGDDKWSSTLYSAGYAWVFYAYANASYRGTSYCVLPVSAL